jgi:phage tail sheath protein FI
MLAAVSASDVPVDGGKARLPIDAINGASLVVKAAGGAGAALFEGEDYAAYYHGGALVIELLPEGAACGAAKVSVGYSAAAPESVTPALVAAGLENIEKCMAATGGAIPDLICAPGYSGDPAVAAVMAVKTTVNGIFRAKALIDIPSGPGGAASYTAAAAVKNAGSFVDKDQILCWPMLRLGDRLFHMSAQMAGLISAVDAANGGIPYESPSNKEFKASGLALGDGAPVSLTHAQANILNANGICTALRFMGGWTAWGNSTACYPGSSDPVASHIPVSRMFGWIGNTVTRTFWKRLDMPMNRRLVENIMDTCNIWLNGLTGAGYILGARVEAREEDNPLADLQAGIVKVRIAMAPPGAAQEIAFILAYDANYLAAALAA